MKGLGLAFSRMKWIGLTGGMGCGKSTVLKEFEKLGFAVVSADVLVHKLYESPVVINEVSKLLNISKEDFSRKKVSEAVFKDAEKLKKLEEMIHPKLKTKVKELKSEFELQKIKAAFYEVPLLFEKSLQDQFDCTICVGVDEDTQFKRIKDRNDWSDEEIKKRLSHQMPLLEKRKLADFYIDNSGTLKDLRESCKALAVKLLI